MNINAQELLLVKRNLKMGEPKPQTAAQMMEQPVEAPVVKMSALEAQAQNNIAFQAMPVAVKKTVQTLIVAGAAALGLATLQSCEPNEDIITQQVDVKVDMELFSTYMQQILDNQNAMLEQQKITNELLMLNNSILLDNQAILMDIYKNGKMTLEQVTEFQGIVAGGLSNIYAQLKENGATDKEILEKLGQVEEQLAGLREDYKAGRLSYEELVRETNKILGSIDGSLKEILAEVKAFRNEMNMHMEDLKNTQKDQIHIMFDMYSEDKNQTALLEKLNQNQADMNGKVDVIAANSFDIVEILKDETKFKALMEQLKNMQAGEEQNDAEFLAEVQKWNKLGVDIKAILQKFAKDNKDGQNAMIGAINANTMWVMALNQKMGDVSHKLGIVVKFLPNLDQSEIKDAINELKEAVDNNTVATDKNTEALYNGYENIEGKLDVIIGQLNTVIENTAGLSQFFADTKENWATALALLGENTNDLKEIRKNQEVGNETLARIEQRMKDLEQAQQTTNSYAYITNQKLDGLKDLIANLEGAGGMTPEQFKEAVKEVAPELLGDIEALLAEVKDEVKDMNGVVKGIDGKLDNLKDYSNQLGRLININDSILQFLKNADFSDPAVLEKLDTIIENQDKFKCDCECNHDSGKTDESVEDLEDIFG